MDIKSSVLQELATASYIEDQGHQYAYLISIFRYVIQVAAFSAFEVAAGQPGMPEQMSEIATKLLQPSDGDFTAALDVCTPSLRRLWPTCAIGWFDARTTNFSASGRETCSAIISKRNDRLGHGVLDANSLHSELVTLASRISELVEILSDFLPAFEQDKSAPVPLLNTPIGNFPIEVLRRHDDKLVLVRRIERRGSVWRVRGQTLSHKISTTVLIEVSDRCALFSDLTSAAALVARTVSLGEGDIWRTSVQRVRCRVPPCRAY